MVSVTGEVSLRGVTRSDYDSNNSKVVVFGNNENGLPLMLNLPPDQETKPTVSPRPTETPRTAPVPGGAGKATPAAPKRTSAAPAPGAAGNAQ